MNEVIIDCLTDDVTGSAIRAHNCKLCSVRNCMSDSILNVALELLYIYEENIRSGDRW